MDERSCPTAEELCAFALGRLPDAGLVRVADHLDRCPACHRAAELLDWADDAVTAALRGPRHPGPYLDEPECQTLLTRAEALAGPSVRPRLWLWLWRIVAHAAAGARAVATRLSWLSRESPGTARRSEIPPIPPDLTHPD